MAIKRAEHDPQIVVVRLQERAGRSCKATLVSAPMGLNTSVNMAPWEIKTVLVRPGSSEVKEVSLLEI